MTCCPAWVGVAVNMATDVKQEHELGMLRNQSLGFWTTMRICRKNSRDFLREEIMMKLELLTLKFEDFEV